tara:strand:- start:271 stop:543 length:273 start_codon:yes stop_codon:yes gene_type:complete
MNHVLLPPWFCYTLLPLESSADENKQNPVFFGTDVLQQRVPCGIHGRTKICGRRLAHIPFSLSTAVFFGIPPLEEKRPNFEFKASIVAAD